MQKFTKKSTIAALTMVLLMMLSACGSENEGNTSSNSCPWSQLSSSQWDKALTNVQNAWDSYGEADTHEIDCNVFDTDQAYVRVSYLMTLELAKHFSTEKLEKAIKEGHFNGLVKTTFDKNKCALDWKNKSAQNHLNNCKK